MKSELTSFQEVRDDEESVEPGHALRLLRLGGVG